MSLCVSLVSGLAAVSVLLGSVSIIIGREP